MVAATVTDCLARARECAAKAEDLTGVEKTKMLEVAEAWLKLADKAAKEATTKTARKPAGANEPPSPRDQ